MKEDNVSERVAALVHQVVEVFQRAERAPDSPMTTFLPAKLRRRYRREAARLRQGRARPLYLNLHSAEELADIYERTIRRDEILDRALEDFRRLTLELGRMVETNSEVGQAMEALFGEVMRAAERDGPGSEAAQRWRIIRFMAWLGKRNASHKRRQRTPAPRHLPPLAMDPSVEARCQATAAEVLRRRPFSAEPVIAIPPERKDGEVRMFIRIGAGYGSWVGHFECGRAMATTIGMMPDDEHLFVSAAGAGYIIDFRSRTLVETIGMDVRGVMGDQRRTVFIVDHKGMSLEAFGRAGRLWKTDAISSRGFRDMAITDTRLLGEAHPPSLGRWVRFSVKLATGEVELDGRP